MLPRDRAEKILTLGAAGWSVPAIAVHLGHSEQTIRDYLTGRRTPGVRAPRPSLLTDLLAGYCRQRFAQDPHLRPSTLFTEVTELGFAGSLRTFYRELTQRRLALSSHAQPPPIPQGTRDPDKVSRPSFPTPARTPVLPRRVTPVTGETLTSYLTRLATANHLSIGEVLAVLPTWFTTKTNNPDERTQHHMLAPATTNALHAFAQLTSTTSAGLAHALPAFGSPDARGPVRATTACHRCTARRGIHQTVPAHLPVHDKVCTRHGIWLSDGDQPHLDVTACPEIITAQHRANRILRRCTPQQLTLAHQAASRAIPAWPASASAIRHHWRHRLLTLQTTNHHRGVPTGHDALTHAAIYPDAVILAAAILTSAASVSPVQP
jgi:hypothetical protein